MIKKLLVLSLVSYTAVLQAQNLKTDVLVIGGSPAGVAAAIQSARSGENTILATDGFHVADGASAETISIHTNNLIPSGLWGEFRNHVRAMYGGGHPTGSSAANSLEFKKTQATLVLKAMTDSVKKLTLDSGLTLSTIEKDGDGFILQN
jgi:alkyl hydroperoxide reductase subunit AhpF